MITVYQSLTVLESQTNEPHHHIIIWHLFCMMTIEPHTCFFHKQFAEHATFGQHFLVFTLLCCKCRTCQTGPLFFKRSEVLFMVAASYQLVVDTVCVFFAHIHSVTLKTHI